MDPKNVYDLNPNKPSDDFTNHSDSFNEEAKADNTLLTVLVWMIVSRLVWYLVPVIMPDFYGTAAFKGWSLLSSVVWATLTIILAILVKNKTLRPILIVVAGLLAMSTLYQAVQPFFNSFFY